jgi:hypothetical protein
MMSPHSGQVVHPPTSRGDAGFTLVEMMVAMGLTVMTLGMTLSVLNGARSASYLGTQVLETNNNLRAGMSFMVRDMSLAGNGIPIGGIPTPSGNGIQPANRPGPAGLRFVLGESLQAVSPGNGLGPLVINQTTDLINVLQVDRSIPLDEWPLTAIGGGGATATIDNRTPITVGPNRVRPGDLIMFSNSRGNAIQTVTSVNGQRMSFAAGDVFNLNQRGATQGSITQLRAGGVFGTTTATRVTMATYYIDALTNPRSPRLVRRRNFDPARAISMVIENLQLTYDLVDGSNQINPALVAIPAPVAPMTAAQIRKINVFLAGRSDEADVQRRRPFRTNLATQVSLRSLAFVDRYR